MRSAQLILWLILLFSGCRQSTDNEEGITIEESIAAPQQVESTEYPKSAFSNELSEERTEWQNPEIVLQAFGDLKGKTIADIGAGAGYFSFKLAREASQVIALDIDPKALEYINEQKEIVGSWSENIETRLTPPDVPNLLSQEVDGVLIVNTISFIPQPEAYFSRLRENMKPQATLVVVDFKEGSIPVGPTEDRKLKSREIRSILRKAGFRKIDIDGKSLQYQYIIKAIK